MEDLKGGILPFSFALSSRFFFSSRRAFSIDKNVRILSYFKVSEYCMRQCVFSFRQKYIFAERADNKVIHVAAHSWVSICLERRTRSRRLVNRAAVDYSLEIAEYSVARYK